MPIFIDRRLNPKDKSLGNRQRFLHRVDLQLGVVFLVVHRHHDRQTVGRQEEGRFGHG